MYLNTSVRLLCIPSYKNNYRNHMCFDTWHLRHKYGRRCYIHQYLNVHRLLKSQNKTVYTLCRFNLLHNIQSYNHDIDRNYFDKNGGKS